MSAYLEIHGLAKRFGDQPVLSSFSLDLAEGEILALLGLSGSGKTTALRILAGFETPDEGSVRVVGEDVTRVPPARRGFGMVFQHYALFPHMTVAENVAFGLESRGRQSDTAERVDAMLELVDLAGFGSRKVSEISGGQQQRVALARALAPEPRVLLLDEPLSNLDPSLRERTRHELRAAVRRIGITTVLVTHEQEEAFHVGDRVAVLHDGELHQVGTPTDLYHRPATRFVATFIGRASALRGRVDTGEPQDPAETWVTLGSAHDSEQPGAQVSWAAEAPEPLPPGSDAELVVKPEGLELVAEGHPGAVAGEVVELRFTGPLTYCRVGLDTGAEVEVLVAAAGSPAAGSAAAGVASSDLAPGGRVHLAPRADGPRPRVFATRPSPASPASPASPVVGGALP